MKPTSLFLIAVVVCLGAIAVGCGPTTTKSAACNADNCWGCCDSDSVCHPGTQNTVCGSQGSACVPCSSGLVCQAGACAFGTGGGGGSGGGRADAGEDGGTGGGGPDGGTRCGDGCTGATPVCDSASQTCVGCTSNLHCFSEAPYCNPALKTCGECNSGLGCGASAPHCDLRGTTAKCVACLSDSHCGPGASMCDLATRQCLTCTVGRGCGGNTPVCDIFVPGGKCVACLADTHCGVGAPFCDLLRRTCVAEQATSQESLATGSNYSCALTQDAGVKCWGYNSYGQLGDGTTIARYTATDVVGLVGDVTELTGGGTFVCARTRTPGMSCWGYNGYGQLGNGATTSSGAPVPVSGLANARSVDLGLYHACALTAAGGVKCWGYNTYGQLGNGVTTTSYTPVDVTGLTSGALLVRAAGYYSCAIVASGRVQCWGYNSYGQLGDGTTTAQRTPVTVQGLSGALGLALGTNHACALTAAGGVKCWGYNSYGQLGNGSSTPSTTPVDVSGLTDVVAIAAGASHTCALTSTGVVKCWGYNYYGQLGDGSTTASNVPMVVLMPAADPVAIAAGDNHTCLRRQSGGVQCWGYNSYGQIGSGGTSTSVLLPTDVMGF